MSLIGSFLAAGFLEVISPESLESVTALKSDASFFQGEITFKNPAARKYPIKDTQTLKEPIRGSHLGKRLHQSESGSTDMDPVVTEFDFIGQGGPRAISGGTHTQSIIQGRENIVHSDVITHMLTNPDQNVARKRLFSVRPTSGEDAHGHIFG